MQDEYVTPLTPPAPWQGGKRHLAQRLVARIEAIPHDIYIEPFLGMGGVFFRRRRRPRIEVVNDLSRDVSNFFRVLQRHPGPLMSELAYGLAMRAEFERQLAANPDTLTDIDRAVRFFTLQRLAFSGKATGQSFGVTNLHPSRLDVPRVRRLLEAIHRRLAAVVIERLPWAEVVSRYDRVGALFYLDPPYYGCEGDYGKGLFGRDEFRRMAEQLSGINGRFLLSLNDAPAVREIFAGFTMEAVETTYTVGSADRAAPAAELIISDGPRPGDGGPQLGLDI